MTLKMKVEYLPCYRKEWERLTYKHIDDSGFDLRACVDSPITLKSGEIALISTGIKIELISLEQTGFFYELQIRARSGLASKYGIGVVNAPGTIDFGYRGEIKTPLINLGKEDFIIQPGDRIAQAVICPVIQAIIEEVDSVQENTTRGNGGFGSTGSK